MIKIQIIAIVWKWTELTVFHIDKILFIHENTNIARIGSTASVPKVLGENKSQNQFSTIFKTFLSDVLKPFYTGFK